MPKNFLFCLAFLIAFSSGIHSWNPFISSARADDAVENEGDEESSGSVLDRPDYDASEPYYRISNPKWAFGLRVAIRMVPTRAAVGSLYQIYGEYLLPYQQIGIFSFGPHAGSFPLYAPDAGIPTDGYANFAAGATLRYQLRLVRNQWVVPTVAVDWDYYRVRQDDNNHFLTGSDLGFGGGIMINLGIFDHATERDGYQSLGLLRSYLTAEIRTLNVNNDLFTLSGSLWLFGVRMEFK